GQPEQYGQHGRHGQVDDQRGERDTDVALRPATCSPGLVHAPVSGAWSGDHGPGVFVLCDRLLLMSGSYVCVEDEGALVIAAVVAAGVGEVGEADAAAGRACADRVFTM